MIYLKWLRRILTKAKYPLIYPPYVRKVPDIVWTLTTLSILKILAIILFSRLDESFWNVIDTERQENRGEFNPSKYSPYAEPQINRNNWDLASQQRFSFLLQIPLHRARFLWHTYGTLWTLWSSDPLLWLRFNSFLNWYKLARP